MIRNEATSASRQEYKTEVRNNNNILYKIAIPLDVTGWDSMFKVPFVRVFANSKDGLRVWIDGGVTVG